MTDVDAHAQSYTKAGCTLSASHEEWGAAVLDGGALLCERASVH